ncbi:MAG: hypothetical protein IJK89_01995 [Clostridia bacterium]|nr:hypothetical protein [Clostridia bacterium]
MLTFFHTYAEKAFPALVKSGLWREGDGLKLMHKPSFQPPCDFNAALAPGAPLETLLKELRCPFYVDRLQGGIGYTRRYPYDAAVIARLRDLLGDRFFGFQMHEWASNLRSDEKRIRELCERENVNENDPAAWAGLWDRVQTTEWELFLEAYPPEEWRELTLSEDVSSFLRNAEALYARRSRETVSDLRSPLSFLTPNSEPRTPNSLLFPADSYFMAPRTELANGARLLLPEVGWQIPNLRVQLAFTRGMANAAKVPWGIYYECWQNTENAGFTIPFSLREGQDEWQEDMLHKANGASLPFDRREYGGSSLSLAARAWRFAYFSGASYLGEEYGVCNTFRSLEDASLSPYGEMKRDFLRFTEAFPDTGSPFVPVAAVLPKEMAMLDIPLGGRWLEYPLTDPGCPLTEPRSRDFRAAMEAIFGRPGQYGNMGHVLKNGGLPAVCDLIYEDMPEAMARYDFLIDLTGKGTLSRRYRNVVSAEEADRALDALLPCRVGRGLTTAYNRAGDGWFVLVMNNDGVQHDGFLPDVKLPEAAVSAPLTTRSPGMTVKKAAGDGALQTDGDACILSLQAGEWLLLTVR